MDRRAGARTCCGTTCRIVDPPGVNADGHLTVDTLAGTRVIAAVRNLRVDDDVATAIGRLQIAASGDEGAAIGPVDSGELTFTNPDALVVFGRVVAELERWHHIAPVR